MTGQAIDDGGDDSPTNRFRPETVGEAFGTAAVVGTAGFVVAFFAFVVYAVAFVPEGGEIPLTNPIVVLWIGSWACVVGSLLGYVGWASRRLRDGSGGSAERQRRVLVALGFAVLFLLAPVAIIAGSPRGA